MQKTGGIEAAVAMAAEVDNDFGVSAVWTDGEEWWVNTDAATLGKAPSKMSKKTAGICVSSDFARLRGDARACLRALAVEVAKEDPLRGLCDAVTEHEEGYGLRWFFEPGAEAPAVPEAA